MQRVLVDELQITLHKRVFDAKTFELKEHWSRYSGLQDIATKVGQKIPHGARSSPSPTFGEWG